MWLANGDQDTKENSPQVARVLEDHQVGRYPPYLGERGASDGTSSPSGVLKRYPFFGGGKGDLATCLLSRRLGRISLSLSPLGLQHQGSQATG